MFSSIYNIFLVLVFVGTAAEAWAQPQFLDLEESKKRCQKSYPDSQEISMDDYRWGLTLLEMEDLFLTLYETGRRPPLHNQYNKDSGEFLLFKNISKYEGIKPLAISPEFIANVTTQIEVAIEKGYADYVFFPDMGHAHLYFPESHWKKKYRPFDTTVTNQHNVYAKMLADPMMRPLYHLAEQLEMMNQETKEVLKDEILNFKYWHRNFVGSNDGSHNYDIYMAPPEKNFNTVSSIEDHHLWSAGFIIHANKNGCFAYKDKDGVKRYFDISIESLKYSSTAHSNLGT